MIDWWGPILFEFYSSTEGMGATAIGSEEWLRKPGSVGKALLGKPYITDDEGNVLPPGEVGTVWFAEVRRSSTTAIRARRPRRMTSAAVPRSATWDTWTRMAICS